MWSVVVVLVQLLGHGANLFVGAVIAARAPVFGRVRGSARPSKISNITADSGTSNATRPLRATGRAQAAPRNRSLGLTPVKKLRVGFWPNPAGGHHQ